MSDLGDSMLNAKSYEHISAQFQNISQWISEAETVEDPDRAKALYQLAMDQTQALADSVRQGLAADDQVRALPRPQGRS
jgi:hypothetical protein